MNDADSIRRAFAPWLGTLDAEDSRLVDDLVMWLVSARGNHDADIELCRVVHQLLEHRHRVQSTDATVAP